MPQALLHRPALPPAFRPWSSAGRGPLGVALAALAAALALPACSHDSYLVVTLTSADGEFTNVSRVDVKVEGDGVESPTLTYLPRAPLTFSSTTGVTLSVSFTPSRSGRVNLTVTALDANRNCLGRGTRAGAMIRKGDVATAAVQLRHDCTITGADGGSTDGGAVDGNVTFEGCDPANPAEKCQSGQTCFVNCRSRQGMCVAGGTKGPGETCVDNNDCAPGTQCFDYSTIAGCAQGTRVCLKFCTSDGMCGVGAPGTGGASAPGAGGAGGSTGGSGGRSGVSGGAGAPGGAAGSSNGAAGAGGASDLMSRDSQALAAAPGDVPPAACRNPVSCNLDNVVVNTTYRTCSFGCDPRGDGTVGCPSGLRCFLYRDPVTGQDNPDCGCRAPTRVKMDGMACASAEECAPGHVCNVMAGTQVCRRLCKAGVATDCPTPRVCQPLTGAAFGVCI